jgi:hypothetical protein
VRDGACAAVLLRRLDILPRYLLALPFAPFSAFAALALLVSLMAFGFDLSSGVMKSITQPLNFRHD